MTNVHSIDFDKSGNMYISQYIANEGSNKGFTFVPKNVLASVQQKILRFFQVLKVFRIRFLIFKEKTY